MHQEGFARFGMKLVPDRSWASGDASGGHTVLGLKPKKKDEFFSSLYLPFLLALMIEFHHFCNVSFVVL